MDLKLNEKKEEKLLERTYIKGVVDFGKAPTVSNDAVKDSIAKQLGKEAKLVVVKHIYTKFGAHTADVIAYAYDNEKKYNELEVSHKKPKKTKEEAAAAAPKKK
jgi:ribosomal protein S24E